MSPQLLSALRRAGIVLMSMIVGGLVAVYPTITGTGALDRDALIRLFVGGAIGVVVSSGGFGLYDGKRAVALAKGDVTALHASDVGSVLAAAHLASLARGHVPPTVIHVPAVPPASGQHP